MDMTQVQLVMRDLLFINYAVPPERLAPLVPDGIELDTVAGKEGREIAFVSIVAFRVRDLRASLLPVPRTGFNQINYRTYVRAGEGHAVYFFDMRINSRAITTASSLLRLPISYEGIEIITEPTATGTDNGDTEFDESIEVKRYTIASSATDGLEAALSIGSRHATVGPDSQSIPMSFITERPVGYISSATQVFKITVEHPPLDSVAARAESVRAPLLASLGILNMNESERPHSSLYVRAAVMDTNLPTLWTP